MSANQHKAIKNALISVYNKEGLKEIVETLHLLGVNIYSTGGTQQFIENLNIPVVPVEALTDYPSILGGRVKTLHPKIFGGILNRRNMPEDIEQITTFDIPQIDLVIVDLYPFEATVASGASHDEIIEKIDIGGVSLIRAAAKNYKDVLVVSCRQQYDNLVEILKSKQGSSIEDRLFFAKQAFQNTYRYDLAIANYFIKDDASKPFNINFTEGKQLRYGENPHQEGIFYGDLQKVFDQLNGKELSYNNLLDVDAALHLIDDFKNDAPTIAIIKHNNACGVSTKPTLLEAWQKALEADPVSAFGGIIVSNTEIDETTAAAIHQIFFEIIIAPSFTPKALELLKTKQNRIILLTKNFEPQKIEYRSLLNGLIKQSKDLITETEQDLKIVTHLSPNAQQIHDMLFANKLVKHSKSNAIVLAKNNQLLASGVGQTSRVDALKQAITKAKSFGLDLKGAVMASDAFFPFSDCVEIANMEGIKAVIQPGGSIKDKDSIEYCNRHEIAMVFTGNRHFKH